MKRGMLIFKKSAKLLTTVIIAGQILTLNPDGSVFAKLTGSGYMPFTVEAAEVQQLAASGVVTYINNPGANPDALFVANPDGTYSLTMYAGTLVEFGLFNTTGGTPTPLQASTFAELAPTPDGNGIYVNAMGAGSQQVQVQGMVNGVPVGNVITVNLTVVEPGAALQSASAVTAQPSATSSHYAYADEHKIVSTDGNLELNLDGMTWNATTTQPAPVIYYAADGILTVECYQCQVIKIPAVCNLAGYHTAPFEGCVQVGGQGQGKKGEIIRELVIHKSDMHWMDPRSESPTTKLPIRIITLGGRYANGAEDTEPIDYGAIYVTQK